METAVLPVPDVPPVVARRAVEWILELQTSNEPATTHAAISAWCCDHPDHQKAWEHVEHLNRQFNVLADPGRAEVAQRALAVSHLSRRHALKALSLLLVTGAYGLGEAGLLNRLQADYYTAKGEQRHLTLAGVDINLNSGSALRVRSQDAVQLLEGEVYIKARSDAFSVQVAQGGVQASEATFSLRYKGDQCRLTVYKGQVDLTIDAGNCRLNAGESTLFTRQGWTPFSVVDADEVAWTEGVIVARAMPLVQFVAELGRYRSGVLRVDPAVAHLSVSGTYPIAQTDQALYTLTAALPVRVHTVTRYWVSILPA